MDETPVQHGGEHPLRPPGLVPLDILQGELPLEGGESLREDLHLLVEVRGMLVAVSEGRLRIGFPDPPPFLPQVRLGRQELVRAHGPGQRGADLRLALRCEDEPVPAGALRMPAVRACGDGVVRLDDPGAAAEAALGQSVHVTRRWRSLRGRCPWSPGPSGSCA